MQNKVFRIILFLLVVLSISSCSIFRKGKKNCGDCPSWSYKNDTIVKASPYGIL